MMRALARLGKLKAILDGRSILRALHYIQLPIVQRSLGIWHVLIDSEVL